MWTSKFGLSNSNLLPSESQSRIVIPLETGTDKRHGKLLFHAPSSTVKPSEKENPSEESCSAWLLSVSSNGGMVHIHRSTYVDPLGDIPTCTSEKAWTHTEYTGHHRKQTLQEHGHATGTSTNHRATIFPFQLTVCHYIEAQGTG